MVKDDVLQAYLNIIYFGRGAYGISAASMAYFGKPVEQLTVADGALLAALIQRPRRWTLRWTSKAPGPMELGARRNGGNQGAAGDRPRSATISPTVPPEQARDETRRPDPTG